MCKSKGIKKALYAGVSFCALISCININNAIGAAIEPASGTTDVTGTDTWDYDSANDSGGAGIANGATDANIRYNNGGGGASLVLTDGDGTGGSANIGTITLNTDAGAHTFTLGDGTEAMTLTINGAVSGNTTTNDLNITVDADEGTGAAGATQTLNIKSTFDLGSGNLSLDADSDGGDAVVNFNGTAAQTVSSTIKGASDNEGDLIISNTHASGATFNGAIGGGSNSLDTIVIGSNANSTSSIAVFASTVDATNGIQVGVDGEAVGATTNTATFKGNVTGAVTLGEAAGGTDTVDSNTATFDSTSGNVTVASAVAANDASDTNAIVIAGGANRVLFSTDMGSNIDTVTINNTSVLELNADGDATSWTLNNASSEIEIDITGAGETYTGTINGASSGVGILDIAETGGQTATFSGKIGNSQALASITLGSSSTNENSTALFQADVSATAVTLGDTNNTNTITIQFDTATDGTSNTVAGTINEIASGTDSIVLLISDTDATSEDSVTFSGALGGSNAIDTLTIGSSSGQDGGKGVFSSTVAATNINIDASDTNNADASQGDFNGAVTVTTMTLTAGDNAAEAATATIAADVTSTNIKLNDSTGATSITFDGSSSQTISGTISGTNDGEGDIVITNTTGATFSGALGTASNSLDTVIVGSSSLAGIATFSSTMDVANGITVGQNGANGTATFKGNITAGTVTLGSGSTANTNTATFDSTNGSITITNALSGGHANDTNDVVIAGGTNAVIFSADIGSNIDTFTVNNSSRVEFNGGATATSYTLNNSTSEIEIDITGADETYAGTIDGAGSGSGVLDIAETGGQTATFSGKVGSSGSLTSLTVGSSSANENSTAKFQSDVTTSSITLGDTNNTNTITIHFDTATDGISNVVSGTIDEIANGTDTTAILITDSNATTEDTVTFSSAIGATNTVDSLSLGSIGDQDGASAIFQSTVSATIINVNATDTNDADSVIADFNSNVTTTDFAIAGGDNAAETALATIAGNLLSTKIALNDGSASATLTFDGTSAQTVSGTINGSTAGNGTLNINNDVSFSDNIGSTRLSAITIAANKTATFGTSGNVRVLGASTITVNGAVKPLDTVQLAGSSTMTFNDGATITISDHTTIDSSTAFIDADTNNATIIIGSGTTKVTLPSSFTSGSINLIDADNGASFTMTGSLDVVGNDVVDYTLTNTSGLVTIAAVTKSPAAIASGLEVSSDAANAFSQALIATAGDTTIAAAYNTAISAGGTELKKAIEQSQNSPAALGAAQSIMVGTSSAVVGATSSHLASLRSGYQYAASGTTGIATGDKYLNNSIWFKPFVSGAVQDKEDNTAGYEARASGIVFGVDFFRNDLINLGLSLSYAKTNIDGDSLSEDETNINSYQGAIYGDYTSNRWYVDAFLGYSFNDTETERIITFGGLNQVAAGNYNGSQYIAKISGGMPIRIGDTNSWITPMIGLNYIHVQNDQYTETGAGANNLTVNPDDIDMIIGSLGARYHAIVTNKKGHEIVPDLRVNMQYDFSGDNASSVTKNPTGGTAFKTESIDTGQFGASTGAGLTYRNNNISISGNVDSEFKKGYSSVTGTFEAKLKF